MHISLLQPKIRRGHIDHNARLVQRLIDQSQGELLVLPEYALTGSLAFEPQADVHAWASRSALAKSRLRLPDGKHLLINSLVDHAGILHNSCELLPTAEYCNKLFPDQMEREAGIHAGTEQKVFELAGKRFKVSICFDFAHLDQFPTHDLDFLLFIYHFTQQNHARVLEEVKKASQSRSLPVLVSSLVSDQNNGCSAYVEGDKVISLSEREGILEVEGI